MTKDDPSDIIDDYFSETAYQNQPFGRTILGPAKNIKKFTREDIVEYVDKQYKTEDIVISFAGKLKSKVYDVCHICKKQMKKSTSSM